MKIAYLSTFFPFRGGIAQFNASLLQAFRQQQHEAEAFNFRRQYPDMLFPGTSQYVTESDKAEPIDSRRLLDTINPISYFITAKAIQKSRPDLMVMKYWMPFFAPSLGTVSWMVKKKTKIITVLDNVIPHERRPGDIALTKFFLNQNDGFVVMSDSVKNDLLKLRPGAKYIYHQHPLFDHFGQKHDTLSARNRLNIPADKKVLLFFGFIRDYKGLDLLIKALKELDNSYVLVIAGEVYGDFAPYTAMIDELGLSGRIIPFVRYINDEEVPLFFSAADVCVLPYKSATQSGITSISFHFNMPVIATDVGGLKEIVEHNVKGLIIAKPEPGLISAGIREYFDKGLKEQFQTNIERFKQDTSWTHLSESIINFSHTLR